MSQLLTSYGIAVVIIGVLVYWGRRNHRTGWQRERQPFFAEDGAYRRMLEDLVLELMGPKARPGERVPERTPSVAGSLLKLNQALESAAGERRSLKMDHS